MILRGWRATLRGKVVGREGIEPSTRGLKVLRESRVLPQKTAHFPLILSPRFWENYTAFWGGLRGEFDSSGDRP